MLFCFGKLFHSTRTFSFGAILLFLLAFQPATFAQATQAIPSATSNAVSASPAGSIEDIQPSFITLSLSDSLSMDTEIIQWPDGSFSIPVKTFAALFDIAVQQSEDDQRLFYVDPTTQQRVDIYWGQQRISVNDRDLPPGKHPIIRSTRGLLIKDDAYLDQSVFSSLFQVNFTFDNDTTTLSLSTSRKLKLPRTDDDSAITDTSDANTRFIRNPEISRSLIDKVYVHHTSNYGYQVSQQPVGLQNRIDNTYFTSLIDSSTVGASGSLFGLNYYVKPTFMRYNKKTNFQQVDWSLYREGKNNVISVGSTDAGLSALTSPTLNIWGLKFASRNATTPTLISKPSYEFMGNASNGNQFTVHLNQRTLQTVTARDNTYEFEPVYLQPQTVNQIQITEKDSQNQETVVLNKTVANFSNMLPKGETAYSGFLGRVPIQFYPLIPNQKTPMRLPQSEKWLSGGRVFYGLANRLTIGVSGAADHIFGDPKTYYTSLNPLSVDLTGFSSYQRDANFFSGQNASATLRYQLTDRWLVTTDVGLGRMNMKPGPLLNIPHTATGKAGQVHLERQGSRLSWYMDGFRYDPYYYTPTVALYGNNLYDKQGVGGGVNGTLSKFFPVSYSFNWSRYQTNLERLIPGGLINANRWGGSLNSQITRKNMLGATLGWVTGTNHEREFLQRSLDLSWRTQSLPLGMQGDVRASHYFTNTLFYPSKTLGTDLIDSPYKNNSLETSLDIPLDKRRQSHFKMGNRVSTFVNYSYLQGFFQFRQFFVEPLIQRSYGDRPQIQNRIGVKVGYQMKSGAQFSLSYYRLNSAFQPSTGSLPASKTDTDQFYVDFNDVLGLLANRLQSLGPNGDATGVLSGTLFADYQPDGKMAKNEPGVKNIKLMIDKQQVVTTDEKGRYRLSGLSPGYHSIEILPEELPLTMSAENPIYRVKIREGKSHRLNIALMPEGGTLSGQLELVDAGGKPVAPKNMTLVLLSPDGQSLKYTAVDGSGQYKFSNVPSGRYQIDLESKIKGSGRYKLLETPSAVEVTVPRNYDESVEIKKLNFKLLAL